MVLEVRVRRSLWKLNLLPPVSIYLLTLPTSRRHRDALSHGNVSENRKHFEPCMVSLFVRGSLGVLVQLSSPLVWCFQVLPCGA